jgi:small subunit ribosomal protein S16
LRNGAKPTEAVEALLKITGDWQKFKGTAGSEGTLKTLPARPDKRVAYEAAVKAAMNEPKDGATTMKKRAAEKLAAKTAPAEESPVAQAEEPAPAAEAPATETPAVETPTETAEQ